MAQIMFAQEMQALSVKAGGSNALEILRNNTPSPLGGNSAGFTLSMASFVLAAVVVSFVLVKSMIDCGMVGGFDHQTSLDRLLGAKHICGNGKSAEWQYMGPQETASFWWNCVWRRFRICSGCGECQYWPSNTAQPGQTRDPYLWLTVMFDKLLEEITKKGVELERERAEAEAERRVEEEKQAQRMREVAAREAVRKDSTEKALDFLNAKVQLINKPDAG